MPVSTSGCKHVFTFRGGGGGCPPVGLRMKEVGSKKLRDVDSLLGSLTAGGKVFLLHESGTVVLLQVLLLPLGVPMPAPPCSTNSPSQDTDV